MRSAAGDLSQSVVSFCGLPTSSQENDDHGEGDYDNACPHKKTTMDQRRQVPPFCSGDITESDKGPGPQQGAGIGEPSKHRRTKLRGTGCQRRDMADSGDKIGNQQHILSPSFHPLIRVS